jgi:phage FluMu gp28-like protein
MIQERKRFNVANCGRRFGKSAMAVNILAETAIKGFPAGYFAPTYKLLEGTYNECLLALNEAVVRKHDNQFIELITGGKIEFWSLDNPQAGRSRKYKEVVVDEAAFVKNLWESWTQAIRPTLTDLKGGAWFLSTPKGKNDFYKLHQRGVTGEANWQSWTMTTYDTPFIDPKEIDDAKRDLPEVAFNQEYLAQFVDNTANPFGLNFIEQCTYPLSNLPPVCFGIDLAKSYDWTVIIGLDVNGSVCWFDRFQKDWKQTITHINNLPVVPISIDTTGVGDPVAEMVDRRYYLDMFKFSNISKQQLMEMLAIAIQQRKINFPAGIIADELSNFEYEYTKNGVKYSAPTGLHDDAVCALALAWRIFKSGAANGHYTII